ncbi:MAG TPA: amidohydrolase family protein [Thermomicrobiales bacterium]|nr:amidohydrolase family protein [Thermomicrobiales bacterium]
MARRMLTGGTVVDVKTGRAEPADILIEANRIAAVGRRDDFGAEPAAERIDVRGKTVLPGLSNNHVHLGWSGMGWDGSPTGILRDQALHDSDGINGVKAAANLQKSLQAGLTSLRDLGMNDSAFDAKEALRRGLIKGPRLSIAGRAIMCTGGHTWWCGREADGPDDVRRAVREQIKRGADIIKIMASEHTPQFSFAELQAAADETHRLGKKITTHSTMPASIRSIVDAGFDSCEHGGYADPDVLEKMAANNVMVVPTLSPAVLQTELGPSRGMPPDVLAARHVRFEKNPIGAALIPMWEAGIKFAFGTDAGSPCVPHDNIVSEMESLLNYGVVATPLDVIQMLTINSAQLRGDDDRLGSLEAGKLADIVVIDGDPLRDISAMRNVVHTFVDGEQLVTDGRVSWWYDW